MRVLIADLRQKAVTLANRVPVVGRPHRGKVGGLWEEMGRHQFEFLRSEGLEPGHYFLDVGCGSLRGGVHFISHLEPGRYFGVDVDTKLLKAGRAELERAGVVGKDPTLVARGDFEFRELGQSFDFALAQSVFTHLTFNSIVRCLAGVERVLAPGGRFYATFFASPGPRLRIEPITMVGTDGAKGDVYIDADPFYYDSDLFNWLCEGSGLECDYRGEWGHPRGQQMLVFTKR